MIPCLCCLIQYNYAICFVCALTLNVNQSSKNMMCSCCCSVAIMLHKPNCFKVNRTAILTTVTLKNFVQYVLLFKTDSPEIQNQWIVIKMQTRWITVCYVLWYQTPGLVRVVGRPVGSPAWDMGYFFVWTGAGRLGGGQGGSHNWVTHPPCCSNSYLFYLVLLLKITLFNIPFTAMGKISRDVTSGKSWSSRRFLREFVG